MEALHSARNSALLEEGLGERSTGGGDGNSDDSPTAARSGAAGGGISVDPPAGRSGAAGGQDGLPLAPVPPNVVQEVPGPDRPSMLVLTCIVITAGIFSLSNRPAMPFLFSEYVTMLAIGLGVLFLYLNMSVGMYFRSRGLPNPYRTGLDVASHLCSIVVVGATFFTILGRPTDVKSPDILLWPGSSSM